MLSFQELYESYAPDVFRFAFSLSGERAEAEDITSETFVRAWVNRSAIRTETLKAYLMTIARNTFLERRRKSRRQRRRKSRRQRRRKSRRQRRKHFNHRRLEKHLLRRENHVAPSR